jgi:hypothetical protein
MSAPELEECRAAIARRFRPDTAWEKAWTYGPADRSPYEGCGRAWLDGSPPKPVPLDPDECKNAQGGWAGSGMLFASLAVEVSDDGATLLRCAGDCTFLRVKDGATIARVSGYEFDGEPILQTAAVKAAMARLRFTSTVSPWPLADAFLDWSLAPKGAAVTYWLRDRLTAARVPLGRFQSKDEYVFPASVQWSRNGHALVLAAWIRPQAQGVSLRDAVVDLPAATALLYLRADESAPTEATRRAGARARRACLALGSR